MLSQPIQVHTSRRAVRSGRALGDSAAALFLLGHIPLALLMQRSSGLTTLHALAVLLLGLAWALSGQRVERVAYIGAYITGAEVLWRMNDASVFWEYGKYATALVFLMAMLRRRQTQGPALPFFYFLLLLPSTIAIATQYGLVAAREDISFNLSGPLALVVSTWFFARLELSPAALRRLFIALLGPAIGIVTIAISATLSATRINFTGESNFITSGGFGPNQVSAMLGLAALIAYLYILDSGAGRALRLLLLGALLVLAAQSALTFSRGGLYSAGGSALLSALFLASDVRSRARLLLLGGLLFVIANFILLPRLDAFTGGALLARFRDTGLTSRDTIVRQDLKTWQERPVFGVGPGRAREYRRSLVDNAAAHTEFTRVLAEHGLLGLIALLLLILTGLHALGKAAGSRSRALTAAMLAWSLLFMLGNAMRLVAPAFIFGLAMARLRDADANPEAQPPPEQPAGQPRGGGR